MYIWKCDVGLAPIQYTFANPPTNISQLTVYDKDAPYVLLSVQSEITLDNNIYPPAYFSNMEMVFGNGASALYATFNYSTLQGSVPPSQGYDIITEEFPSMKAMYKNTTDELMKTVNDNRAVFCHITALKRIIILSSSSSIGIGSVDDNGNITYFPNTSARYVFPAGQAIATANMDLYYPYIVGEYKDGFSFSNNNAKSVHIRLNNGIKQGGWKGADSWYSISCLFGEYVPPDFDIPSGPYEPGGESGEGDLPPGTFDDTSDPIPDSPLPSISASDTGFTRIYNPTLSQVQDLARYLWTEPSLIDTIWNKIKQFFENPMDAIIGFNLVPCRVPDGGTREFAVMYIGTGVQMTAAANQFVDVDCGIVELDRYYGSALDQNPYTKVSCFLPYIGTIHLNTDEVMGSTLQVKYRIDIVTGSCVAKILVDGSVLYQYSGHCAISIPISASDFSSYVSAAISVGTALAGMAVGAAAGGSAGAGSGIAQSTGVSSASTSTAISATSQNVPATIGQHEFAAQQLAYMQANPPSSGAGTQASFSGLNPENIVNTVGQVMGGKMQVEHSGAFSGNSGYLGVRRPFLIIERPNMCLPATYGRLNGYPSMITLNLGECSGFTRVQQVQLTGCTATNPEQSEILQFLKSGVVL